MRVLGLDPGKRNSYFVVWKPNLLRIATTGELDMMPDAKIGERLPWVRDQVRIMISQTKPDLVAVERYINRRGGIRGNVSEHVNILIGLLYDKCVRSHVPFTTVMAGSHKTWCKRKWGCHPEDKWKSWFSNAHLADALSIAKYGYLSWLKSL